MFVEGIINSTTNVELIKLLDANPRVTTLVLTNVPGSMDDDVNVVAGRQIRKRGLTTLLLERSTVSSGGTDLFLAGESRIIVKGARIGVHSWAGSASGWLGWIPWVTVTGRDVPKGDAAHQIFLNYYCDIDISEDFYWFTLDRAPVDGMHWMTAQEIARFGVATQIVGSASTQ